VPPNCGADFHFGIDFKRCSADALRERLRATAYRLSGLLRLPTGRALARYAPRVARAIAAIHHAQLAALPVRIAIPAPAAGRRTGELRPGALGPASRLRRRYADAPAGAPRGAPSAPVGARRRFPPASKSGLLAAFIFSRETIHFGIRRRLWRVLANPQTTNLGVGGSNPSGRAS
jgi:hypothetical protein